MWVWVDLSAARAAGEDLHPCCEARAVLGREVAAGTRVS